MKTKRIGVEKARVKLTSILKRVHTEREALLICNHGKPLALIVPIDAVLKP